MFLLLLKYNMSFWIDFDKFMIDRILMKMGITYTFPIRVLRGARAISESRF